MLLVFFAGLFLPSLGFSTINYVQDNYETALRGVRGRPRDCAALRRVEVSFPTGASFACAIKDLI